MAKGQIRTNEKSSLEFAQSNLVKFCKKSSQHMQKTPGSSPWILQCSSGSHRISFQSQTLQDMTRYDNIVTTHSPGSFAFFVSFLPTHLPIPFRVVKVVKVVLDFNNPMPPICLWSKVTTPGILAPRVPQFHQRQQSVRG